MVAPLGHRRQHLVLIRRTSEGFTRERLEAVRFVPLIREPDTRGHAAGDHVLRQVRPILGRLLQELEHELLHPPRQPVAHLVRERRRPVNP